jgi:hypothetical protein
MLNNLLACDGRVTIEEIKLLGVVKKAFGF